MQQGVCVLSFHPNTCFQQSNFPNNYAFGNNNNNNKNRHEHTNTLITVKTKQVAISKLHKQNILSIDNSQVNEKCAL